MRSTIYFILICGFSVFSMTAPGQISWVNPLPQGNTLRALCFTEDQIGFLAGDAGTLLRSNNNGVSWVIVDSVTVNNLHAIGCFENSTLLMAGDSGILLRSSDAGFNWERLQGASNKTVNALCIIDSLTALTVGDQGTITKTTDGGNTWYQVTSPTFLHLSDVCFPDDTTGYAVGGDKGLNGIVLKTADQGETWDTLSTQFEGHLYAVHFFDAERGYLAGNYSRIFKTISGGQIWAPLNNPYLGGNHHIRDMVFSDFNTGFTVDIHGHIMRTFNAGATWDSLFSKVNSALYALGFNDEGTLYAAGLWGKITRSPDLGLNWQPISYGPYINLVSIDFPQPQTGFITGSGGFFKSENSGQQWDYQEAIELTYAVDADFLSAQVGYVLDIDGAIFRTGDGGETWTEQNTGVKGETYNAIFMVNPTLGYAVGGGTSVSGSWSLALRTIDGENWTSMSVGAGAPLNDVAFSDASNGLVAGNAGTLMRTANSGNSWQDISPDTTYNYVDIEFLTKETAFLVGNKQGSSKVFRTDDGGNSWQEFFHPQDLKQNEKINAVRFADQVNGFAIGTNGLIYKTITGGDNWFRVGKVTSIPFNDVYPRGGFDGFIVGTGGTILRMDPVLGIESIISEENYAFSIFPNPASGATRLRYLIRDSGYLISDLYMISGIKIRELARKKVNAGEYETEIDLSGLPSGIYVVRMQTGDKSAAQKLIIR